jgi:dTDP-4-amino-4,6-dideoxygalactose transaminase
VTPREIPITDLGPGQRALRPALEQAMSRVLASGVFIGGPEVEAFERELAGYLGVRACVGLNSGTDALVIGLRCFELRPGDEVLVPAFGFVATAEAVCAVGAVPVFVDIDPRTMNLDPRALRPALTRRTRGVIPVHLFGQAAPMDELLELGRQHSLFVLEDAAQALGGHHRQRKVGSLGHAAALSFFPSKNLGACGDAGLLATDDEALGELARELRQHGSKLKYQSTRVGYNSRLDALQAAILRVKLPGLDADISRRRDAAERYDALLEGLPLERPYQDPSAHHTFHQYTVRLPPERRDEVQRHLAEQAITSVVHYPIPLHLQPAYRSADPVRLPHAEAAARSVLSLPIWPEISAADQERVASALRVALGGSGQRT